MNQTEDKYYSEVTLESILKQDIFSLGILILECIQDIPNDKKIKQIPEEEIRYMLQNCKSHYSNFIYTMLKNMVCQNPDDRWDLHHLQDYLEHFHAEENPYKT